MLKYRLVFSFLMSLVLSSLMSGWVTYLNLGFAPDFFNFWFSAFLLAWPVAGVIAFVLGPQVQSCSKYIAAKW